MSKGSQTSTTKSEPWGPAQPYLKDGLEAASDLFKSGGMTTDYSGDWVADMTSGQNSALQGIIGQAGQNSGVLNGLIGSLTGLANGSESTGNWDAIATDTMQKIMPGINSSFAGSGMTGSTLHQQNLSQGLGQGMAMARSDFDQQQVSNRLNATNQISGLLGQLTGNAQSVFDAESAYQDQTQRELDSQYTNGLLGQNAELEGLQNYLSLISGVGGMGGTSTGTQTQKPGLLGALSGLASGLSLLSDRRLKTNIKRVGSLENGLGVYTYRYRGSDTVHMGVMAQEVAEVMPEAVTTQSGHLAVNYGAL